MSKMMSDCWLSPHGDVYYCFSHIAEANNIIDKYGLNDEFAESRFIFPMLSHFLNRRAG